jgi:DNA-binding transcriptional MerR regulator
MAKPLKSSFKKDQRKLTEQNGMSTERSLIADESELTTSAGHKIWQTEWTIREISQLYKVSYRTLRYYEQFGCIRPRRSGQARFYSIEDRLRIQMVLKGKKLGFSLSEIREVFYRGGIDNASRFEDKLRPQQIADQIVHLERQRDDINYAIQHLRALHKRLEHEDVTGTGT